MAGLDEVLELGTCTFRPRNRTGLIVNGMDTPSNLRCGSSSLPVEPSKEVHWHLGTLAAIPDHANHSDTLESRYWQEAGELATKQVSSAYCRMLTLRDELENWYPRSILVVMVSTREFITVLKMTLIEGHPDTPPSVRKS